MSPIAARKRTSRDFRVPTTEVAPLYSITSSARPSSIAGISRPSAFAVLRLMTQLEFGRLVKRDISRIRTFENFIDEVGEAAKNVRKVDRISHQPANFDIFAERINCGNAAFRGQFDNRRTMDAVLGFIRYHERIRSILFHRSEDALVLCLVKSAAQDSRRQRNACAVWPPLALPHLLDLPRMVAMQGNRRWTVLASPRPAAPYVCQ